MKRLVLAGVALSLALAAPVLAGELRKPLYNVAHVANPSGGDNPLGAILHAESMNARNNVLVVIDRCQSSCWIKWNMVRRKCFVGRTPVFSQHAYTMAGTKVNVHSRSRDYWLRMGREGSGSGWVEWRPGKSFRCSRRVMNMPSTSSFRKSRSHGRTPSIFRIR